MKTEKKRFPRPVLSLNFPYLSYKTGNLSVVSDNCIHYSVIPQPFRSYLFLQKVCCGKTRMSKRKKEKEKTDRPLFLQQKREFSSDCHSQLLVHQYMSIDGFKQQPLYCYASIMVTMPTLCPRLARYVNEGDWLLTKTGWPWLCQETNSGKLISPAFIVVLCLKHVTESTLYIVQ